MKTVDLNLAATFVCEECGRDNFIHTPRNEATEQANPEFNCVVTLPDKVTCKHCNTTFAANDGAFGTEVSPGGKNDDL